MQGSFFEIWGDPPESKTVLPFKAAMEPASNPSEPEVPCPEPPERPFSILDRAGCRLTRVDGALTVDVWSDLDSPEIRAVLRRVGSDQLPLRCLGGTAIPMTYKIRRVER
jgi:hypothetical protein